MQRRPDAQLIGCLAARGCGKSTKLRRWIAERKAKRLAIWDTKREHGDSVSHSTADMGDFVRALKGKSWRIAFQPDMHDPKRRAAQFEIFCRAVYIAKHCDAVVEELAFVTTPSRSPPAWRVLSLLGRDENPEGGDVTVWANAQRPASIDKDFVGNCTTLHVGRLSFEGDAEAVAKTIGVPKTELMTLKPLHWITRGEHDDAPQKTVLKFSASSLSTTPKKTTLRRPPKGVAVQPESE